MYRGVCVSWFSFMFIKFSASTDYCTPFTAVKCLRQRSLTAQVIIKYLVFGFEFPFCQWALENKQPNKKSKYNPFRVRIISFAISPSIALFPFKLRQMFLFFFFSYFISTTCSGHYFRGYGASPSARPDR